MLKSADAVGQRAYRNEKRQAPNKNNYTAIPTNKHKDEQTDEQTRKHQKLKNETPKTQKPKRREAKNAKTKRKT